jgi:hypothetical protein
MGPEFEPRTPHQINQILTLFCKYQKISGATPVLPKAKKSEDIYFHLVGNTCHKKGQSKLLSIIAINVTIKIFYKTDTQSKQLHWLSV